MKRFLLPCVTLLGLLGCVSRVPDVAASKIHYEREDKDGSKIEIDLWSPREVEIGSAMVNPETGLLVITNYSATPNAAALRAQVDERREFREMWQQGMLASKDLAAMAVLGWTGRESQRPGNVGTLSPETISNLVAAIRGTNSPH